MDTADSDGRKDSGSSKQKLHWHCGDTIGLQIGATRSVTPR